MLRQLAATALVPAVLTSLAAAAAPAAPQDADAAPWPAADPVDVGTIDALLESLYDVISGDAGEARDWDRFRSLFHPELGRLTPLRPDPAKGTWDIVSMTPDDYVAQAERWTQRWKLRRKPRWRRRSKNSRSGTPRPGRPNGLSSLATIPLGSVPTRAAAAPPPLSGRMGPRAMTWTIAAERACR